MKQDIFIEEYKNIKEVDNKKFADDLINVNHSISQTKKGLRCAKRIKKIQLKYRVFKRKKYDRYLISYMVLGDLAKALHELEKPNLTDRKAFNAMNDSEIYQFELALANDESREYVYNSEIDDCIKVYKSDIRLLKIRKRKIISEYLKEQFDNIRVINRIDKMDQETLNSSTERRVLRRFLR